MNVTKPASKSQEMLDRMMAEYTPIKPEALLVELDDILRARPTSSELGSSSDEAVAWIGRVKAALHHWDSVQATSMMRIEPKLHSTMSRDLETGYREVLALIHQARHSVLLRVDQESVAAEHGQVHQYFDGLRKLIERASADLFFIDPYLDADFITRYPVYAAKGVKIRLLTKHKLKTLLPAVEMFAAEHGTAIEVRTAEALHDRYVLIDGKECFQSGATFHQGAKTAGTSIVPLVDVFPAVQKVCEDLWANAKVIR
jgi:hypothetical protein